MGFKDDTEIYPYRHKEWKAGSVWNFRRFKLKPDEDKVASLAYDYQMPSFTPAQIREAQKAGRDLTEDIKITQTQKMSPQLAELWWMSEGWEGPEHDVPPDFPARDANGKRLLDKKGKPVLHELAGKPAPCTLEWIARLERHQFDDAYRVMTMLWEGGTESDAAFPAAGEDTPESEVAAVPAGSNALSG